MKKIAIVQSNYIPWKGYFDLISYVDEFIFYDEVQYTKNDWRNRNKIKTPNGETWLTIPVGINLNQKISETKVPQGWQKKHLKSIEYSYSKAKNFNEIYQFLDEIYTQKYYSLSELNITFIKRISNYLGIDTIFNTSKNFNIYGNKNEKLICLCKETNANCYVSGPSARAYLDINLFKRNNILVEWFDYSGYKEYDQLWGDFTHHVSILDLIFNHGKNSKKFMKFI